ncbi:MAG: SurA N-terminal domain-containing protein [Pseudomonadota bacterium]
MNRAKQYPLIFWVGVLISLFAAFGCPDNKVEKENEYLIRVDDQVMTFLDFTKAMEFSSTAYPHNEIQNKEVLKTIRLRLMNQLIEEMILVRKARDLNIVVSEAEIQAAVDEIKKDYPDDQFRETFLENAVPYETWKNRLKMRLLMEKVISAELEDKIEITRDDIAGYHKDHYGDDKLEMETMNDTPDINEVIVRSIRRKKAEDAYKSWINDVRNEYKIEINKKLWERILES